MEYTAIVENLENTEEFKAMKTYHLTFVFIVRALSCLQNLNTVKSWPQSNSLAASKFCVMPYITSKNRIHNYPEYSIKMLPVHVRYGLKKHTCSAVLPDPENCCSLLVTEHGSVAIR